MRYIGHRLFNFFLSFLLQGLLLCFLGLFLAGCGAAKKNMEVKNLNNVEKTDRRSYEYVFTEANKNQLFGNLRNAEKLYQECLKVNDTASAVYYQLSQIHAMLDQPDDAIKYGQKAEQYDSSNFWYLLHQARLYEMTENREELKKVYKRIVDQFDDRTQFGVNLAKIYFQDEEYQKSLDLCNSLMQRTGYLKEIGEIRYSIFRRQGKDDLAEKEINKLNEAFPGNVDYQLEHAEFLVRNEHYDRADNVYKQILNSRDSSDSDVLLSYYLFLEAKGDVVGANKVMFHFFDNHDIEKQTKYQVYQDLISDVDSVDPFIDSLSQLFVQQYSDDFNTRALASDYYFKTDQILSAKKQMMELLEIDQSNFLVWSQLFYIHNRLKNFDSLYHYAQEAISIFPDKSEPYLFKGIAASQKEDYKKSVDALKKGILKADSGNIEVLSSLYSFLGESAHNAELYTLSDSAFEKAIQLHPHDYTSKNNYAYYLSLRGDHLQRAKELSQATLQNEPDNFVYLDTYGWILFKMGDVKKAKKFVKRALNNGGDEHADILEHYGDILVQLGHEEEAIDYYNKALSVSEKDQKDLKEKMENTRDSLK
ncbi:MAG: tetratricopeptide repeat protein [bacterium]